MGSYFLDLLQFQSRKLVLLQHLVWHKVAQKLFMDFSSAFNPASYLLRSRDVNVDLKLWLFHSDPHLVRDTLSDAQESPHFDHLCCSLHIFLPNVPPDCHQLQYWLYIYENVCNPVCKIWPLLQNHQSHDAFSQSRRPDGHLGSGCEGRAGDKTVSTPRHPDGSFMFFIHFKTHSMNRIQIWTSSAWSR